MTPLKAIRLRCLDCKETTTEIRNCEFGKDDPSNANSPKACPLYPFRMQKKEVKGSTLKAIRKYCLWCMNGQANEIQLCPSMDCPLYQYRFGKNPARKGIGGKGNLEALKLAKKAKMSQNT